MPISDQLYSALEKMKYGINGEPLGPCSTSWIHVQDAVDLGTISPMEAYDAIRLGYVPEYLLCRKSRYSSQVLHHC